MKTMKIKDDIELTALTESIVDKDMALELAKKYLCQYDFGENCGRCSGCDLADDGLHPDIFFCGSGYFPVKAENIIKNAEEMQYHTGRRCKRILIIEEDQPAGFTVWRSFE